MRRVLYILSFVVFLAGCSDLLRSGENAHPYRPSDLRLEKEEMEWVRGGIQSEITDLISQEAANIKGLSRRERLYGAKDYMLRTFSYDNWYNSSSFQKTADELFRAKVLGGCGDFALAEMTLYRAVGIPSRLVVTANVDWMMQYHPDSVAMTEGHSFIEVYLEDRWYLADPTYRWLFGNYRPDVPCYPHGEYFYKRGRDFWDMGIRNNLDFDKALRELAQSFKDECAFPDYPKDPL